MNDNNMAIKETKDVKTSMMNTILRKCLAMLITFPFTVVGMYLCYWIYHFVLIILSSGR